MSMASAFTDNNVVDAINQLIHKSMSAAESAQRITRQNLQPTTSGYGALATTTRSMNDLDTAIQSTVSNFSSRSPCQQAAKQQEIVKAFRNFVMNQQGLLNILRNRANLNPNLTPKIAPPMTVSMQNLTTDTVNLADMLIDTCPDLQNDLRNLAADLKRTETHALIAWTG